MENQNGPSQTLPESTPSQSIAHHLPFYKKHKISLFIILLLVLILIVPFVPFPYYQFENAQCKVGATNCPEKGWHLGLSLWQTLTYSTSGPPTVEIQVTNPSPTPTSDPAANWKTYENEEFGFEVRHPEDWAIGVTERDSVVTQMPYTGLFVEIYAGSIFDVRRSNICYTHYSQDFPYWDYSESIKRPSITTKDNIQLRKISSPPSLQENRGYGYYACAADKRIAIEAVSSSDVTEELFDQILSTFRFVGNSEASSPTSCVNDPEGAPVITSISPGSDPVGTLVEIKGCNLSGFEGDLDAVFVRSDGAKIPLYGGVREYSYGEPEFMKVTVQSYCESGYIIGLYSGITSPCETIEATPGIYKVYVTAWGKKSNEVNFTITE